MLCTDITETIGHISLCIDSFEATMPPAVVADQAAHLRDKVNAILIKRHVLSHEMHFWQTIVAEQLSPLEQRNDTIPSLAPVLKRYRVQVRKSTYLPETDSAHSEDSLTTNPKNDPRLSCRSKPHVRLLSTYLCRQKRPRYSGLKKPSSTSAWYVDALLYRSYYLEDASQTCSSCDTGKVSKYT